MVSKRVIFAILLVGFIVSESNAQFNRFRRRGTIIGGVAGAAIGAAIADGNDAVGVVIGGAAGAVVGRSIGANKDFRTQNSRQYYSGHSYSQPHQSYSQPYSQQAAPVIVPVTPAVVATPFVTQQTPISHDDVVSMLQSGLSEQIVAAQIQRRGVQNSLGVNDIIRLHQQGVSERLIDLMQANVSSSAANPVAQSGSSAAYYAPQPVQQSSPYGQSILLPPANAVQHGN